MSAGLLRQPLRMLLLPTRPSTEGACGLALKAALTALGIPPNDFLPWVSLSLEQWQTTGHPSQQLRSTARSVILATCQNSGNDVATYGTQLANRYFELHQKLREEHLMSHEEATAFLSHAFLIAHLSSAEKLSAAQIANLLTQRDQRARFSRQSVLTALQGMRVGPSLTLRQIVSLYGRDTTQELMTLADSDLLTAAEIVAAAGRRLGYPGNMLHPLTTLMPTTDMAGLNSRFTPYLQILHYQCCVAEFYDHALADIYEFSPRGRKGEWLHRRYPNSIAGAGNPFLNNAKSVEVVDASWVRSKKTGDRPGAMALLTLLEGMQGMGFFARRELAWWMRLWLHRIIRIAGTTAIAIPEILQPAQIVRLVAAISQGNSETFGILEQRVLDAVTSTLHQGWRARGVGDSVNATNTSRAKLGDCEFLDPSTRTLEAYESHGGDLSSLYVDEHIATLRNSIVRRIDELSAISDPANWNARITFVGHRVIDSIRVSVEIEGLQISLRALTFNDFLAEHAATVTPALIAAFTDHLLTPLRERRTPNEVRRTLLAIIGS